MVRCTLGRKKPSKGRIHNMSKSSRVWLRRRGRFHVSIEKLGLNGFSVPEIEKRRLGHNEADLANIAGSMTSGFSLIPVYLAQYLNMPALPLA